MMSERTDRQTLMSLITHKQESLQYLTVDSATYLHWRAVARNLNLTTDCDVATFLLQHYEKTSDLQLTQCVKCGGSVVQYCVPCNIYMTQPTSAPPPTLTLPHDNAALSVCDETILSSDTVLLDLGEVGGTDQFLLQDIALKMDNKADNPVTEERREIISATPLVQDRAEGTISGQREELREQGGPSRLRMLVEACSMEAEFKSMPLSSSSQSRGKSLLTPDVLHKLKSRAPKPGETTVIAMAGSKATAAKGDAVSSCVAVEPLTAQKAVESAPSVQSSQNEAEPVSSSLTFQKERDCLSFIAASLSKSSTSEQSSTAMLRKGTECWPSSETSEKVDSLQSSKTSQKEAQQSTATTSTAILRKEAGRWPSSATCQKEAGYSLSVTQSSTSSVCCPEKDTEGYAQSSLTPESQTTSSRAETPQHPHITADRSVPEAVSSEDEDSDYHCEPLFTPQHRQEDPQTDQIVASSSRNDPTGRAELGGMRTRSSPRKHRASYTNNKENADGINAQAAEGTVKTENLDSPVIVISDRKNNCYQLSRIQDTNQSVTPVYRSKRIAARMAAKARLRGDADVKPEPNDVNCKDTSASGKVSRVSGKVSDKVSGVRGKVSNKVSGVRGKISNVSGKADNVNDKVSDGDSSKVSDLGSKVSIILDCDTGPADESSTGVPCKRRKTNHSKDTKTYRCPGCSKEFRLKQDRTLHIKEKHGDRPYACSQCSATYTTASHLRAHVNQHADIKPHACPLCPRTFARAYDLKVHHTGHFEEPVMCEVCGVVLKNFQFLKSHRRTHNGTDKPLVCQICGMGFRWGCNLRDHLRVHNNDKRFACPECPVRCIQKGSLNRHIERKHNPGRARTFICDICGEARYDKTQFRKHMMIHTGEKPFVCDVCGAAFIQANALAGHKKIHSEREGKSHFCSVCGAAFKMLSSVKKHMNKVHKADSSQLSVVAVEIIDVQP